MLHSDLLQEGPFVSSGFSAEETFISASMVPNHERRQTNKVVRLHTHTPLNSWRSAGGGGWKYQPISMLSACCWLDVFSGPSIKEHGEVNARKKPTFRSSRYLGKRSAVLVYSLLGNDDESSSMAVILQRWSIKLWERQRERDRQQS